MIGFFLTTTLSKGDCSPCSSGHWAPSREASCHCPRRPSPTPPATSLPSACAHWAWKAVPSSLCTSAPSWWRNDPQPHCICRGSPKRQPWNWVPGKQLGPRVNVLTKEREREREERKDKQGTVFHSDILFREQLENFF